MRSLQVATTLFVVAGIGALLSFPWTVGATPGADATAQAKADYAVRLLIFFAFAGACFIIAALLAMILVRRIRGEYREQLVSNLADLLTAPPKKKEDSGEDDTTT
ncbi:MAG: hypothetical protein C4341_05665 [Armatimonadota bacterium]